MSTSQSIHSSTTYALKRPIRRVALACIPCSSRKVKCNAIVPNCKRCQSDGNICDFQKSRRGSRPRRPTTAPLQTPATDALAQEKQQSTSFLGDISCITLEHRQTGYDLSNSIPTESPTQGVTDTSDSASHPDTITLGGVCFTWTRRDQLLSSYFVFFHTAHTCVLPKWKLQTQLVSQPIAAEVLLPVLLYIGSIL
jgi:hypothetical protein